MTRSKGDGVRWGISFWAGLGGDVNPGVRLGALRHGVAFTVGFTPMFSIAATNIALTLFILMWAIDLARKETGFRCHRTPFDLALGFAFAVWLAAAVAGLHPAQSLMTVIRFKHPALLYLFLFAYGGRLIPTALLGIGMGMGLNTVYGWGQHLLWEQLYDFRGGDRPDWLFALGEKARRYVVLSPKDERIHGALHLMTYSELLVPLFLFLCARYLEKGRVHRDLAASLLTGIALVFTAQRGALLSAMAGILVLALLHRRRLRLVAPLAVLGAMTLIYPMSRQKFAKMTWEGTGGENHRIALWKGGIYITRRHPWIGVGPGQIKLATQRYKTDPGFPPNTKGQEGDLHSLYFQRLAEMGVPGLLATLGLMASFLAAGIGLYRRREGIAPRLPGWSAGTCNALATGILATFAAGVVMNMTERAFDDAEVATVYWLLAAGAVWLARGTEDPKRMPRIS